MPEVPVAVIGNAFPGLDPRNLHRQTIPMPKNPMDMCTVFSVYPFEIREEKITIVPSTYIIPAGTREKPGRLLVTSASYWRDIAEDQPLIEVPVSSLQVAEKLADDYCKSVILARPNERPGLFFIPGDVPTVVALKDHKARFDEAEANQRRWAFSLIKMADSIWARAQGNPLAIPDTCRWAAQYVGVENKDWLKNAQAQEAVRCVACGSLRNPEYPICPSCKTVVDAELAKKLNLKFLE